MQHGRQRTLSVRDFTGNARIIIDGMLKSGEEIVLTQDGKPVARIAPVEQSLEDMGHPVHHDWSNDE